MNIFGYALKKWLWCSWLHYEHRCYPEVWDPQSNLWHCTKCHPCSEGLDQFMACAAIAKAKQVLGSEVMK